MCYIPYRNQTLPKPYPFIITYPIHHPILNTKTGRVLPCASINTTLPWIPTYPYPSETLHEYLHYPTLPTIGKIPLPTLRSTPPTLSTSPQPTYVPTSHYLLLHTRTGISLSLYHCQGLIKYKAETTYQIRPKRLRPKRLRAEMIHG